MKKLLLLTLFLSSLVSIGQVYLNEVQSSNGSTISDNMGEFDDWIEIYNPTTDSLEIGGLILKDRIDTWAIPSTDSSTLIPPGGYFLLWADDQESQGIFHTNFKLASGGEFLGLYENDGLTIIDSITLPALSKDDSYIRCDSVWLKTDKPTPLDINNCVVGLTESTRFDDLFSIVVSNEKQLKVTILDYFNSQRSISIYSIDGKELIRETLSNKSTVLNLNVLETSTYIVTISTTDFLYSRKIRLP